MRSKNAITLLSLLLAIVWITGMVHPVDASARQAQLEQGSTVNVDSEVLSEMATNGSASYWIDFSNNVDLSAAYSMGWEERGRYVFDMLSAAAQKSQSRVVSYLDANGIAYQSYWIKNSILVEKSTLNTLNGLLNFPEIKAITTRHGYTLYEPDKSKAVFSSGIQAVEPNLVHINADDVWAMGITGTGMVVANIDTGVRYTHNALVNQYRGNQGGGVFSHDYNWFDPYNNLAAPIDDNGHGTHTMGTMVGDDGISNKIGVAPGAEWMACRGCTSSGCTDAALLSCGQWIAAPTTVSGANPNPDLRPKVVNNSWGDCEQAYNSWYSAPINAWHAAGIYPIFSNGNSSNCSYASPPGLNTVGNPARSGNVTGIGSSGEQNGQYASHSNWGPTDNLDTINPTAGFEMMKPQVVAPGVSIRSSTPGSDTEYQDGWSGTSMSAPHVSGLVALIWQAAPCLTGNYAATESLIEETAVDIVYDDGSPTTPTNFPNFATGWGEIDALAAINRALTMCGPSGYLSGVVTNASTGLPLAGVNVAVNAQNAVTGADGSYSFQLPVGTYSAGFSAYGYLPHTAQNISVVANGTTTLNVAMQTAPLRTISGTVRDATPGGHTWPLYARIDIVGYPNSPIFTHTVHGTYSVDLPEGTQFTFTVTAIQPGYLPSSQTITVPAGNQVLDFGLVVDAQKCEVQGYALSGGWMENFDGVTAPALPAGWAMVQTAGSNTSTAWATNAGTRNPAGSASQSGPNLAFFNAFSVTSGNAARLYQTSSLNMTTLSNSSLAFWMFHDTGYSGSPDSLQAQVSTDNGATWVNVGSPITRWASSNAWQNHVVDLSAYAAATNLRIGFLATSAYGNDIHIDSIRLGVNCTAIPGARLSGNVYDANTTAPLIGAMVNTGAMTTATIATPQDGALNDGFYAAFAPAGASVPVSVSKMYYAPLTLNLALPADASVAQDFYLEAGRLTANPTAITQTLPMGETATRTLALSNSGGANTDFLIKELAAPGARPPLTENLGAGRPPVSDNLELSAANSGASDPLESRQGIKILPNAGLVLRSFPTGLAYPWGIGYNTIADDLWISNLAVAGGDNQNYHFLPDGARIGDPIDVSPWVGDFAADMTYNPFTGMLWQVNVGGDNCFHELNPYAHTATGNIICPPIGSSERGLAFDPLTNTYFSGSWNEKIIHRIAPDGAILEAVNVNLGIAGLAFNPSTGHLFVAENGGSIAIHVLDVNANYAEIGAFNVPELHSGEAGLEIDCDGHLWAVNQTNHTVYEIASDETGVCDWMGVSWLGENPASASLAPAATQPVTLDFNAGSLMPGVYTAELLVTANAPYAPAAIPVSLTVTLPDGYGEITGDVMALERCDINPAPLPGALVEIIPGGTTVPVYTATSDAAGHYIWAAPAGGPYTLRISANGYVQQEIVFTLSANQILTRNFELRSALPCITSSVGSLAAVLPENSTGVIEFTLNNRGAAAGAYTLRENTATGTIGRNLPEATLITESFEGVFPPAGWTQVAHNAYTWTASNKNSHSGIMSADIVYDSALNQQDEWLVSPVLYLAEGTLSLWSMGSTYWCKVENNNCDLNIWIVKGEVGGGDDILVGKADDAWTGSFIWAQSTFVLTPHLTGDPIRIGFQYYGRDGAEVTLDDISLTGVENQDVPWFSEAPVSGVIAGGAGEQIAVTFNSTGMIRGIYRANLRVDLGQYGFINIPVTMVVGPRIYLPTIFK